jgi:hypothetical protein
MAALLGVQEPRVANSPKSRWSDADDCAFLAEAYGLKPDPWQLNVLNAWMSRDKSGKWLAGRWGITVPRQNGKNGILEMVELFFMAQLGLKILHTAHEVKTARKAFLRIASFFENERKYPELAALVKDIRKTNGQEAIVLHNGGSVEFIARSKGSGRGFTVDVLVCDEAQEYGEDAQAALLPTISSAPSGDPLQILLGTPPAPNMDGDVFTRMRTAGVAGKDKRLAWVEWSVTGNVDVADRDLWAATNPSLGIRLNQTTIEDEFGAMSPETFARERLGMWASDEQLSVIPSPVWADLAVSMAPDSPVAAYGIDMNPERTKATIAVGLRSETGVHVELAEMGEITENTGALIEWLVSRAGKRIPVVMDAYSPARSLEPALKRRGVKVFALSGNELMQACGGFYDAAVKDASLSHYNQQQLNVSLAGAKKASLGDAGGWKWSRKTLEVDLTPLLSATCAHFGVAKFAKPPRKVRTGALVM